MKLPALLLLSLLAAPARADIVEDGQLILGGTATVQGNAFSVGTASFVVSASSIGIRTASPGAALDVAGSVQIGTGTAKSTFTAAGLLKLTGAGIQWADGSTSTTGASGTAATTLTASSATTNMTPTSFTGPAAMGPCVTGSTLTFTSNGANVAVWYNGSWTNDSNGYLEIMSILIDGNFPAGYSSSSPMLKDVGDSATNPQSVSLFRVLPVSAGQHTYCLTATAIGTAPKVTVPSSGVVGQFGVMELK